MLLGELPGCYLEVPSNYKARNLGLSSRMSFAYRSFELLHTWRVYCWGDPRECSVEFGAIWTIWTYNRALLQFPGVNELRAVLDTAASSTSLRPSNQPAPNGHTLCTATRGESCKRGAPYPLSSASSASNGEEGEPGREPLSRLDKMYNLHSLFEAY